MQLPDPLIDAEHEAWVVAEHARAAHKLLRVLRRVEALEASTSLAGSSTAAADVGLAQADTTHTDVVRAEAPKRRKRCKDRGFLAPVGHGEPGVPPISDADRHVANRLRAALGVLPGACPSLEDVNAQMDAVLAVLHGVGDGWDAGPSARFSDSHTVYSATYVHVD